MPLSDIPEIVRKIHESLEEQRETVLLYRKALRQGVEAESAHKKAVAEATVENKGMTPEAVRKAYVEFYVFDLWKEALTVEAQKLALRATLEMLSKELDVYRSLLSAEKEEAKLVGYGT